MNMGTVTKVTIHEMPVCFRAFWLRKQPRKLGAGRTKWCWAGKGLVHDLSESWQPGREPSRSQRPVHGGGRTDRVCTGGPRTFIHGSLCPRRCNSRSRTTLTLVTSHAPTPACSVVQTTMEATTSAAIDGKLRELHFG